MVPKFIQKIIFKKYQKNIKKRIQKNIQIMDIKCIYFLLKLNMMNHVSDRFFR